MYPRTLMADVKLRVRRRQSRRPWKPECMGNLVGKEDLNVSNYVVTFYR